MKVTNSRPIIGIIFLAVLNSSALSQATPDTSNSNSMKSFFSAVAGDILHVAASPFHMSRVGTIKFIAFVAINTVLIYEVDEPIDDDFAVEERHDYLKPAEELADLGDSYDRIGPGTILAGVTTTLLLGGVILKDKKLLETTRLLVESSLITGFITHSGKVLFNRSRPYTGRGSKDFHPFKFSTAHEVSSFPSGHSSNIFSLTTVLTKQYSSWWLKIPAYTLAVAVALQRMDDRQHWTSDVVVGGFIGYWVGSTLVNGYQTELQRISISPYFQRNQIGMRVLF